MSETTEQVKPTRYKTNERYKLTADLASKRQKFQFGLYREWMRRNVPDVFMEIRRLSYEKFPTPDKGPILAKREEVERLLDSMSSKKNGVR